MGFATRLPRLFVIERFRKEGRRRRRRGTCIAVQVRYEYGGASRTAEGNWWAANGKALRRRADPWLMQIVRDALTFNHSLARLFAKRQHP